MTQAAKPAAAAVQKARKPRLVETDVVVAERVAALAAAREAFPVLFDVATPVPLAVGAHSTIKTALGLSSASAGELMRWWTSSPRYLAAVAAPGSTRRSLDGNNAGPVSDEHRRTAAKRLLFLRMASRLPE